MHGVPGPELVSMEYHTSPQPSDDYFDENDDGESNGKSDGSSVCSLSELGYRYFPLFITGEFEEIEDYQPGGLHPIYIGDTFDDGRYVILHKLGIGGSSTVWLARDLRKGGERGSLVALKAMLDCSSFPDGPNEAPEVVISKKLEESWPGSDFQVIDRHFIVEGPNGSHLFLIFPLAGPSIRKLYHSYHVEGDPRLRGDLARKVAKQAAMALYRMHSIGIVHGDFTTSNILFRLSSQVIHWSDAEVYANLGEPKTEEIMTSREEPPDHHAPPHVVKSMDNKLFEDRGILEESVIVSDFGLSYLTDSLPSSYQPCTAFIYQSPEMLFEGRGGIEADVWALGCVIFEIRTGNPLFENPLQHKPILSKDMVEIFGRFPDPWWNSFKQRTTWFDEEGTPHSLESQKLRGLTFTASKTSIRELLSKVGATEKPLLYHNGPFMEKAGQRLREDEVTLLEDLLMKMFEYLPEKRIRMEDVIKHPWFLL